MDATRISNEHLAIIDTVSSEALNIFETTPQEEIAHFVFCGVKKLHKIAQAIHLAYGQLEANKDLEFSIGILLRSLMMDGFLIQNIKHTIFTYVQNNPQWHKDGLRKEIATLCYKFISDGTDQLIKGVYASDDLTEEQKPQIAEKFAKRFPKAFDLSGEKPKLLPAYKFTLARLFTESFHPDLVSRNEINNLYAFYSKYDHLSHWTAAADQIPFERRKGKIDLAIVLVVMQFRDLLVLAYDFDEHYSHLEPLLEKLQQQLTNEYDPEIRKQPLS